MERPTGASPWFIGCFKTGLRASPVTMTDFGLLVANTDFDSMTAKGRQALKVLLISW